MQIQHGIKTNIHLNSNSYYGKKSVESLVLNAEMLIQTLFSIGMK